MKKTIKSALIFSVIFIFNSCVKEHHFIRFRNNYNEQFNNITIGTANIGSVAPGATSDYKSINSGNSSIYGSSASGKSLTGSGSISGQGTHSWTMTLDRFGKISCIEEL